MSILRPLRHDDLEALMPVQREGAIAGLSDIFPQQTHPFPIAEVRSRWAKEIDDPAVEAYAIIDRSGVLAGFSATRGAEFLHFGTALSTWGTGLAQQAHDATVERLRAAGHDTAHLRVFEENQRARRLYERNGWRPDGSRTQTSFAPHPVLLGYTLDLHRPASEPFVLEPEEPYAGPFEPIPDAELRATVLARMPQSAGLALVDGRSGSGKSTFAERLGRLLDAPVVHTDDVAWHLHPVEWSEALVSGILEPWRRGAAISYRPPGWIEKDRAGSIDVPANSPLLVVEGVGAARPSLRAKADFAAWVQSDRTVARDRGIRRDVTLGRTPHEAVEFWDEWGSTEDPFLAQARPWEGADLVVTGTPTSTPGDDDRTFVSRTASER